MYETHLRVAAHGGAIYIDLANPERQVVKVTAEGWSVIDQAPVKFLRVKAARSLPTPMAGESVELINVLINTRTRGDFLLIVGWIIGALSPRGPYPILAINGEQGSGKSYLSRICRALTDPNVSPIRSAPKDEQSLIVAAESSWVLAFDNMSGIAAGLSDGAPLMASK